jgi:hypothetical protein
MNRHVSIGDALFLVAVSAVLVMLWWLFSPPVGFVISCAGLGALTSIVIRILRARAIKSAFALVLVPLLIALLSLRDYYFPLSQIVRASLVFIGVFASAFAVGVCVAELSVRPFLPIKRVEKQT